MKLTTEHEELRRSLRKLIDTEINPHVDEWEKAGVFPAHELFKKLGNAGFLGISKPVEYGGAGLDYSYSMVMAEELGTIHCGGVPMAIGVPMKTKGVSIARKLDKLGMWSSDTAQIHFDKVRVPQRNRIGEEGMGFVYQMVQFQEERLWGAASALKGMEYVIASTVEYTRAPEKRQTTIGRNYG